MADPSGLTAMLSAFTPGGALLFGLCTGSMIFLISRLDLRLRLLHSREVRSLHIELGGITGAKPELDRESIVVDDFSPGTRGQSQQAASRWWRTDEVLDESMGIS